MKKLRQISGARLKLRSAFLLVAVLGVYPALFAGTTNQWKISPEDLKLNLPVGITNRGSYKVEISRKFGNEDEARLFKIAEATYPPKAVVLEARSKRGGDKSTVTPSEEYLWWSSSFDGVHSAFAITGRAVEYYLRLTDEFQSGNFKNSAGIKMLSSELKYTASIERKANFRFGGTAFEDVYVVSMKLSWHQHCGNLCAMFFTQQRTVVMNKKGEVLMVSGDKEPSMAVS